MMDTKARWETIYQKKQPNEVSWFQREATLSLALIRRMAPELGSAIVDVGGGASFAFVAVAVCVALDEGCAIRLCQRL